MSQSRFSQSRFITHTISNAAGRTFAVRYVPTGAAYGLNDCLKNGLGPMIEFYLIVDNGDGLDGPQRFVARYYVETFLDREAHHGLALVGGDSDWDLTAANCQEVADELPVEDLRDTLRGVDEVLARGRRLDEGLCLYRVKVRRVVVMTAEVEASDEDEAAEAAIEQAQSGDVEWTSDGSDDSDFEVSDVEEI